MSSPSNVYDSLVAINQESDVLPPAMCRKAWWPSTRKEMSSRKQCVRQHGGHRLGKRCVPASNVYDSMVAINQEKDDVFPPAMCTIAWWPPARKEMSSRQKCVREPTGHQLGKRSVPTSNVYDSLVAIGYERDVLPPGMCTIAWQTSTRKVMSSRQQGVLQPGGHQQGQRCPPARNVYESLVDINQERDVLPRAMCRIVWWISTRKEMSYRNQCVGQYSCYQLGKRCPPASKVHQSLVAINQDRDVLPPAMSTIAWWPSTRKAIFSHKECVRQHGGHQLGKRCSPARNVYDSMAANNQVRDALWPAMCTIAWWPSTRKKMCSRKQCVRQPGGHRPGKRCTPASNVFDSLVAINKEKDLFPPAMCMIAWWQSTRKQISSRQQCVQQPGVHQVGKRCLPASY